MSEFKLKPQDAPESAILNAVLKYLALDHRVAWAHRMNSGASAAVGVDAKGRPTRRFIRYGFPGCADILGQVVTGHFLAIEVKSATGRATPDQKAFLASVRDAGGVAVLARSIADVQEALGEFEPLAGAPRSLMTLQPTGAPQSAISRLLSRHQQQP